jgi:diazepam-binding inhibitor (GABA receptor modulating acyl-CoA-binding protein)
MSDIKDFFKDACEQAKGFGEKLSNNEKLTLYKYFKQATEGKCSIERPGMFDPRGQAKWDAWSSLKSMSKEDAMYKYCEQITLLKEKY